MAQDVYLSGQSLFSIFSTSFFRGPSNITGLVAAYHSGLALPTGPAVNTMYSTGHRDKNEK